MKKELLTILCAGLTFGATAADTNPSQDPFARTKSIAKPKQSIELLGGTPQDFIDRLQEAFPNENIAKRTSYLIDQGDVELPMLRVHTDSAEHVLKLYNRLSEIKPEWGEWIWEGDFAESPSIVLVERKPGAARPMTANQPSSFTRRLQSVVSVPKTVRPATIKKPSWPSLPTRLSGQFQSDQAASADPFASASVKPVRTKPDTVLFTRVFATGTLAEKDVEGMLVMIDESMGMLSEEMGKHGQKPIPSPKLRYHSRSKAVIVVGTETAMKVVEEVVSALMKSMDKGSPARDPFSGPAPKARKPVKANSPF